MSRPGAPLTVSVTDARGRPVPRERLGAWLAGAAPRAADGCTVAIALVSDRAMRTLNGRFRRTPVATDVLSFPAAPPAAGRGRGSGRGRPRFLGDLAIARGVAARQARQFGHPVATELRILALHGLLHLLGYDHETDAGAMRRLEERLRRRAQLPAGLVARGGAQRSDRAQ